LNDAALANRRRQFVELGLGKIPAWIARIGPQELDRHSPLAARAFERRRLLADVADERRESAPQSRPHRFFCHCVLPRARTQCHSGSRIFIRTKN
jgi:hypothetical protein